MGLDSDSDSGRMLFSKNKAEGNVTYFLQAGYQLHRRAAIVCAEIGARK